MKKFVKESQNGKKIMFELVAPSYHRDLAKILTFGATKYKIDNWKHAGLTDLHHYTGAIFRHLNQYREGEVFDSETKVQHMAHIGVNAMFLHYFARNYGWTIE